MPDCPVTPRAITEMGHTATVAMLRHNSENGLQTAIELMLTDHSTEEVCRHLRTWADYLDERR